MKRAARYTGVSKNSIKKWLKNPDFVYQRYGINPINPSIHVPLKGNKTPIPAEIQHQDISPWQSLEEIETVDKALGTRTFRISRRTNFHTDDVVKSYSRVEKSPIGEQLVAIRTFIEKWYSIWWDDNNMHTSNKKRAKERWDELANWKLPECCKYFSGFQRRMSNDLFNSLATSFDNTDFETTNNSAERYARGIKKIQKSRYRLRTQKSMENFIKLNNFLKNRPLQYEKMEKDFFTVIQIE